MSYIDIFLKLTALEIQLDNTQRQLDAARARYGHHKVVRSQLDFRQGQLDAQREQLNETVRKIALSN